MKIDNVLKGSQLWPFLLVAISSIIIFLIIGCLVKYSDFFSVLNNFTYGNIQSIHTPSLDAVIIITNSMGGGIFIKLSCLLVSIWLIYKRRFLVVMHLYAGL